MAKKQALIYSQLPYLQLINTEAANKALGGDILTAGPLNGKWLDSTGDYYRSVVFTSDGYILTHGLALKVINTSLSQGVTVTNTNGSLVVNVGGIASTGVNILTGATNGNHTTASVDKGIVTFNHNSPVTYKSGDSTLGATFGSGGNKYVLSTKSAAYDTYGHINHVDTVSSLHLDYITDDVITSPASGNTNYYLLGALSSSKATDYYAPKKHAGLYASVDKDGKVTLHADNIAASISSLTGTLSVGHGGTGTTSFTSGEVLVGNGTGAIYTKGIDTTVTDLSTKLITSGAVYTAIANSFAANDAMVFKGITGAPTSTGKAVVTPNTDNAGYTWKVGTAGYFNPSDGKIYTTSGTGRQKVEIGDLIICIIDAKTENGTTTNATYGVIQTNIENPISGFIAQSTKTDNSLTRYIRLDSDGYLYTTLILREVKIDGELKIANSADTALNFKAGTGLEVTYDSGIKYSLSSISGLTAGSSGIYKIAFNTQGQITSASSWDPNTLIIKSAGSDITNAVAYDPDSTTALTINFTNGLSATWANNIYTVGHSTSVGTAGTTEGSIYKFTYDTYGHIAKTKVWDPSTITFSGVKSGSYSGTALSGSNIPVFDPDGTSLTVKGGRGIVIWKDSSNNIVFGHSSNGANNGSTKTISKTARTYIDSITIDEYGHVTSVGTGSESVVNTWRPVYAYNINGTALKDDSAALGDSTSTSALAFGAEFAFAEGDSTINANNVSEIHLAWAEIDSNGNISYAI